MSRHLRSTPSSPREERLFDLLYERAFAPLTPEQQRELDALSAQSPDIDLDCYDRAAAAIDLQCREGRVASMPTDLRDRILSQAPISPSKRDTRANEASKRDSRANETPKRDSRANPAPKRDTPTPSPRAVPAPAAARPTFVAWSGWIAAAAATIVAVVGWMRTPPAPVVVDVPTPTPSVAEQRAELLAQAKDVVTLSWKPTDDPHGKGVSGDIVWSPGLQRGFMRFRGLPRNEAGRSQYQLWIFDKPRGTDHPVDGGVFDVATVDGEWIVPIDAKLKVFEPALFAVTEEPPGGVVVSKREHIVALAQL